MDTHPTPEDNPILVVDDTRSIRFFLEKLLASYAVHAVFATNGQEAVDRWEEDDFSLILMDIEMPVMNGFEATRTIRQREKRQQKKYTPIVGVSGIPGTQSKQLCLQAGMDDFLSKPIPIREVMDIISSYVVIH